MTFTGFSRNSRNAINVPLGYVIQSTYPGWQRRGLATRSRVTTKGSRTPKSEIRATTIRLQGITSEFGVATSGIQGTK